MKAKNKINLLMCDIDGTLQTSDYRITDATIAAFKKVNEKGIKVVLATGRTFSEAAESVDAIGAFPYLIGVNGAMTMNLETGEILNEAYLPERDVVKIIDLLRELRVFYEMYTAYGTMAEPWAKTYFGTTGIHHNYFENCLSKMFYLNDIKVFAKRTHKFFIATQDADMKEKLEKLCKDMDVLVISSLDAHIEIVPKDCSKFTGAKIVCEKMGVSFDEVMAIGDAENDMDILKAAGIGVAMENAPDFVKQCADYVTLSNDENGAADAINRLLLK